MHKKNKQKITSVFKNNLYMLGKVIKYAPEYFILKLIHGSLCGFADFIGASFSLHLLNEVSSGGDFIKAITLIGLMALFQLFFISYDNWFVLIKHESICKKIHLKMHNELFFKSLSLDLACFDDPEFYNDFVWAMNESDTRAMAVYNDLGDLVRRIIASISIFSLLLSIDPIIALIILVSTIITMIFNHLGNKVSFNHNKETNALWRKRNYINRVYHLADYAKELRIGDVDTLLMDEYDDNNQKIIETDIKYGKKYFIFYGIGWNFISNITFFALLIYMVIGLKTGSITVGGFAATINIIWRIRWSLISLAEQIVKFPQHSLFIEKYLKFMRFTPTIKEGKTDIPKFESLEFKNVSFSYEFSSHPKYKYHEEDYKPPKQTYQNTEALKNVNLKITKGEKIAIVGYNGAGKTTLIKLIMRLYDPTEGEILYNGINIKEFDPTVYRKIIGTVFQDYKIFATSLAKNVMNGDFDEKTDTGTVLKSLEKADFTNKLTELKDGIDTHLTREFNDHGTNLSGGESQKVAIARVFSKEYPIVIMDEPSSALDPMAEYNLNQSILDNTHDKTVIFISHRLSTTRIADKIYMFDNGKLIELGSHDDLLSKNGKYAEMFNLQASKYKT